ASGKTGRTQWWGYLFLPNLSIRVSPGCARAPGAHATRLAQGCRPAVGDCTMAAYKGLFRPLLAAALLLTLAQTAHAARLHYHYVPVDPNGHVTFKPGPCAGERVTLAGKRCDNCPPPPNCYQAFRHPCSGQMVVVPLNLPFGTPTIYHRPDRIVYNYGSDF